MRIVGVVVVDRDPGEARAQLRLGAGHHLAREGRQIGDQLAPLGRHDQPEMALVARRPVCRPGGAVHALGDRVIERGIHARPAREIIGMRPAALDLVLAAGALSRGEQRLFAIVPAGRIAGDRCQTTPRFTR